MDSRRELFNAPQPGPKQKMQNYGTPSSEREFPGACDDDQDVDEGKMFRSMLQYYHSRMQEYTMT